MDEASSMLSNEILSFIARLPKGADLNFRSIDLNSDEFFDYRKIQAREKNPLLGQRGLQYALLEPELITLELLALNKLPPSTKGRVVYSLPFVRGRREVEIFSRYVLDEARVSPKLELPKRLGVFIETPSAARFLQRYFDSGATELYIGIKDLSAIFFGCDRNDNIISDLIEIDCEEFLSYINDICEVADTIGFKVYCFVLNEYYDLFSRSLPSYVRFSVCYGDYVARNPKQLHQASS